MFYPFEVNPEGSQVPTYVAKTYGFNGPELAVREYVMGQAIEEDFSYQPGIALRYWTEVFISTEDHAQVRKEKKWSKPVDRGLEQI